MTTDPDDPNRAYEYPSLENSPPPVDPNAPVDYPADYPPSAPGYPPPFPPPFQGYDPYDPYGASRPQGTNGRAIGAFVTSLVGLPLCWCFIPSIVAVVLGVIAMNETKQSGQEGHGLALAAVVIGAITLVGGVLLLVIGAAADTTDSSY